MHKIAGEQRDWRCSFYGNKRWARKAPTKDQYNSILGRCEELHEHIAAVDNVHDVTTEFDRKVARYVRALHSKKVSQKQARAVLKKRRVRRSFLFL